MEHTLPPPPPPDAPRPDTFYADLLHWGARLICYPLYRPFTHLPATWGRAFATMGLRALLMAGLVGILFKLAQHGLLLWALAHHSRLDPPIRPAGPWPLTAPLTEWQVVGLVVLFAVLLLDRQNPRWPVHLTWTPPFVELGAQDPLLRLVSADPDVLVLGRPYTRTWNELENRMETMPQEDAVYTVGQAELCTHATVVAPTRAGKTFNVTIPLIEFVDRREGAGIFIDAKGDDLTGPRFDSQYPGAFHRRFNLLDGDAPRGFRLLAKPPGRRATAHGPRAGRRFPLPASWALL
jgi:hypothetical protein